MRCKCVQFRSGYEATIAATARFATVYLLDRIVGVGFEHGSMPCWRVDLTGHQGNNAASLGNAASAAARVSRSVGLTNGRSVLLRRP